MLNLAYEVNEVLKALGWGDLKVEHYFNSVELYDAFIVSEGDQHIVTTFKVDHSQIESGEATPRKIAGGIIIDYITNEQQKAPDSLSKVTVPCYILEDIKETLKQAATDIAILIGRELEDAKKAEENGVSSYLSLESFYRFDLENVNQAIKKLSSL